MSGKTPLIGVVCGHQQDPERFYVNAPYIHALQRAGGTPVLIPLPPKEQLLEILSMFAGILLPGGIDIDPARFGEQPHPRCGQIDPIWDEPRHNSRELGFGEQRTHPGHLSRHPGAECGGRRNSCAGYRLAGAGSHQAPTGSSPVGMQLTIFLSSPAAG